MRPRTTLAILVSLWLVSATLRAQPVDDASRAAARRLGEDGIALAEKGDHTAALDRFDRALELMRVPTLAVLSAQSLEKLGRLVEAAERYRQATGMPIDESLPKAFQDTQAEARAQAETARARLAERIPTLTLVVGEPSEGAEVLVDGKPISHALLGVAMPLDPGVHRVELRREGRGEQRQVTLRERQSERIELSLGEAPTRASASKPRAREPAHAPRDALPGGAPWRTIGWASIAVGTVGLGVGGVAYAIARGKANDLEERCPSDRCPASQGDAVDSYQSAKVTATIGLVVAGVGLGAGTVVLLTSPRPDSPAGPSVGFGLGPGQVELSGRF